MRSWSVLFLVSGCVDVPRRCGRHGVLVPMWCSCRIDLDVGGFDRRVDLVARSELQRIERGCGDLRGRWQGSIDAHPDSFAEAVDITDCSIPQIPSTRFGGRLSGQGDRVRSYDGKRRACQLSGDHHPDPGPIGRRDLPLRRVTIDQVPFHSGCLPGVDVHDECGECGDPGELEGAAARLVAMDRGEQHEGGGGECEYCGAGVLP